MTNYDNYKQLFNEFKSISVVEVPKKSLIILELYIFLEKNEQKEFLDSLKIWMDRERGLHPLRVSYAKLILAFGLFYREQYDDALPLIIETQNLFNDQNDLDGAAVCILLQGSIYRTFGNVDLALKALWTAHEQLKKSDSFQHFRMACGIAIGGTYCEMKHLDAAIPLFTETLEMAERMDKYYWIIYALHGLGKVYLIQKKYPEAKNCLERAIQASEKFNSPLSIGNSLSELGNYYFAVEDYPEAEQFHKQSLALREQNKFIGGAITSCIRLGEIYIKQNKLIEALGILNKGLNLAEQIKVKPKMYQIHFLLSEIYQNKNELNNSLVHYKLFHELREQVEVEDNARKIKNTQLIFEAEQTMKENIIIKKQKEEIERKNIELQETIDELTLARVGRKAKAITLIIAIVLFIMEDIILHFALKFVPAENYIISLLVKMVIIFSLSPINKAVEHYLLKRIIKKRAREVVV